MIDHAVQPVYRPNILFIVCDQLRADAIGLVSQFVRTPNIDALGNSGVVCGNAFTQSPQCQPSRASIFTGRYPTAHRVWWNETALSTREKTIANYLVDAGYTTGYFGKLHFDGAGSHTAIANRFGFQKTFLFEDWQLIVSGIESVVNEFYGPMSTDTWVGELTRKELHHEEVVAGKAIEFMGSVDRPWFAVVGFHGPHPPYAAPVEFSSLYDSVDFAVPDSGILTHTGYSMRKRDWRGLKKQYFGAISWIDDCVGRLVAAAGPNTIIVFLSDHGDILGDHGLFSKGMYAYDGNVKVPLIMRLPGFSPMRYKHLVQLVDVVPTVLDAIGVAVPVAVQGVSLLRGFRKDVSLMDSVVSMIGRGPRLRMVRTMAYKYWVCGDREFLFNLSSDPHERVNISKSPVALSEMRFRLIQALIRAEDPLPVGR